MPASDVMLACVSLCFHHSRPEVPLNASHASDKEKYLQAKMVRERRRFHPTSWCHRFNLPVQLRPGSTDSHSGIDGGLGAVPNETFLPSGFTSHISTARTATSAPIIYVLSVRVTPTLDMPNDTYIMLGILRASEVDARGEHALLSDQGAAIVLVYINHPSNHPRPLRIPWSRYP